MDFGTKTYNAWTTRYLDPPGLLEEGRRPTTQALDPPWFEVLALVLGGARPSSSLLGWGLEAWAP